MTEPLSTRSSYDVPGKLMHTPVQSGKLPIELKSVYSARFSGSEAYRNRIWRVLISEFFSRWVRPNHSVLDLGCGYCEFINNVSAGKKFAMDLNPAVHRYVAAGTRFLEQDCSDRWDLPDDSLDIVFSSNFFEHLSTKSALKSALREASRCLKPDGLLIAVGPNIKYLHGKYWDFFDHHIPLTENSLSELCYLAGFKIERATAKFLPYTMSRGFQPPIWSLRLYLKLPLLWRFFGRQFVVIARK